MLVAVTSPLPAEEARRARALLAGWPLGEVLRLEPALGGATNRVYRVETAARIAFLRIYKRADRALAEREHALIARVRAHGLPAVATIVARSGSTVVEHEGAVAALYEAASGIQLRGPDLSLEQASAAGALLARLHQVLATVEDTGYLHWTLSWDGPAWVERLNIVERALIARCRPAGELVDGGPPERDASDETDRWALERLRAQRRWLATPECLHRYQPRSPAQIVHGDFQDANLFFEGERVSAVIDWEQAAFMPRGYEVARACSLMFRLRPEPTLRFLRAYNEENELALETLVDGARAWGCFADHHVWPLEEVYLNGNDAARRYIPHSPFRPFAQAWAELRLG